MPISARASRGPRAPRSVSRSRTAPARSSLASVAPAAPLARGLGRLAAAPEHFRLDPELVPATVLARAPCVLDLRLEPGDAIGHEPGLLEVGQIRKTQRRRRVLELLKQQLDARPPDRAHLDRPRL